MGWTISGGGRLRVRFPSPPPPHTPPTFLPHPHTCPCLTPYTLPSVHSHPSTTALPAACNAVPFRLPAASHTRTASNTDYQHRCRILPTAPAPHKTHGTASPDAVARHLHAGKFAGYPAPRTARLHATRLLLRTLLHRYFRVYTLLWCGHGGRMTKRACVVLLGLSWCAICAFVWGRRVDLPALTFTCAPAALHKTSLSDFHAHCTHCNHTGEEEEGKNYTHLQDFPRATNS